MCPLFEGSTVYSITVTSDQAQMNLEELKCGDVVRLKSRNESVVAVSGVIKWIGEHHSRGILAGIELWVSV